MCLCLTLCDNNNNSGDGVLIATALIYYAG